MPRRVVMVATSYPRFPGDTVGTFMQPIAAGIAALGYDVHMVIPAHPLLRRAAEENGVHFHPFDYVPMRDWHVFGYAGALREDVRLRGRAMAVAPAAMLAGWAAVRRVVRATGASLVHGHWLVPGGALACWAARGRPVVVSLHGSDVYLAERHALPRLVARRVLRTASAIVACSDDLRARAVALGAPAASSVTIPYGVDTSRFRPDEALRARVRAEQGFDARDHLVFAIGRFVRKKGFEHLIDALASLAARDPRVTLVLAGWGDLETELRERAAARGLGDRVRFAGLVPHEAVPGWLAAADVVAVPSVRDDAGNVDGLPNVVLEGLASGTPVVATAAGGIPAVVHDDRTGLIVPERNAEALARAIERVLSDPGERRRLGTAARQQMLTSGGWDAAVRRLAGVYDRVIERAAAG